MGIVGVIILVIIVVAIFLTLAIIGKGYVLTLIKNKTKKVLKIIISHMFLSFKESFKQLFSFRSLIACLLAFLFSVVFKLMLSSCFSNELGEREIVDPISSDWYINAFFTKTSAMEGTNIEDLFNTLAEKYLTDIAGLIIEKEKIQIKKEDIKKNKKKGCC